MYLFPSVGDRTHPGKRASVDFADDARFFVIGIRRPFL
jgi:hypothetical protein